MYALLKNWDAEDGASEVKDLMTKFSKIKYLTTVCKIISNSTTIIIFGTSKDASWPSQGVFNFILLTPKTEHIERHRCPYGRVLQQPDETITIYSR